MKVRKAVLVAVLMLLAACASPRESDQETSEEITWIVPGLSSIGRYVDEEAGVVCWIYNGYEKGGIDCLPIADTRLGR